MRSVRILATAACAGAVLGLPVAMAQAASAVPTGDNPACSDAKMVLDDAKDDLKLAKGSGATPAEIKGFEKDVQSAAKNVADACGIHKPVHAGLGGGQDDTPVQLAGGITLVAASGLGAAALLRRRGTGLAR